MEAQSSVESIVRRLRVDDALRAAVAAELHGGGRLLVGGSGLGGPGLDSSGSSSSSSGSDAASSHGAGSLFKLTCSPFAENTEACDVMDLSLLGLMLLGLVIVTVVIELLVEHLEESLGGVGKVLKEKVFKECALLGIVSFAALVSIHLPISMNHNIFLVFELAHVLMFAMALVFSTLVGFISYFLRMISNRWAAADQHEPDDLYRLWCRSLEKLSGSASGANALFPEISDASRTTGSTDGRPSRSRSTVCCRKRRRRRTMSHSSDGSPPRARRPRAYLPS